MKESISIIEATGVFPFSEKELSLWCRHLDQEYILVEKGEGGLVKAYHYNGEIKPFNNFKLKINNGSIGYCICENPEYLGYPDDDGGIEYCIDENPEHLGYPDDDGEVEESDIPKKYVISCISYDETGQPMAFEYLRGSNIYQIMYESDTNTYLLLECLVKQIDILNSR